MLNYIALYLREAAAKKSLLWFDDDSTTEKASYFVSFEFFVHVSCSLLRTLIKNDETMLHAIINFPSIPNAKTDSVSTKKLCTLPLIYYMVTTSKRFGHPETEEAVYYSRVIPCVQNMPSEMG